MVYFDAVVVVVPVIVGLITFGCFLIICCLRWRQYRQASASAGVHQFPVTTPYDTVVLPPNRDGVIQNHPQQSSVQHQQPYYPSYVQNQSPYTVAPQSQQASYPPPAVSNSSTFYPTSSYPTASYPTASYPSVTPLPGYENQRKEQEVNDVPSYPPPAYDYCSTSFNMICLSDSKL